MHKASASDPSSPEAPIPFKGYRFLPDTISYATLAELPRSAESAWSRRRWLHAVLKGGASPGDRRVNITVEQQAFLSKGLHNRAKRFGTLSSGRLD
jgi:hypothetical protein